ncbi:hypothetical protein BCR35DRAFT_329810 [Leucosporidium creatinivorum]|uniref:DNA replication complex GINS protein PSF2 n=1 Tax=Leucosporidium creatinivorum TaxID=106004 RepID=A0A1Y2FYY0_9BASI|nr:hypothetical protein BCR35DRAFT_329810 [Leucosporidium creatinivorum]
MALSHRRRWGLTPQDLDFANQEREIEIVPMVRLPLTSSNDGPLAPQFGPFNPPQKAKVPLWFALQMKKKGKCRIVVPGWLSVASLEETLREETSSDDFSPLPRDYVELSNTLLHLASDDFPLHSSSDKVKILLKDIREARQAKIRVGAGALNPVHLAMPHLSSMEILELRPTFSTAFQRLRELNPEAERHEAIAGMWLEKEGEARRRAELGEFERGDAQEGMEEEY